MTDSNVLEKLNRALGSVRAEYSDDDELYGRLALPVYVHQLAGITPTFLVGGRGTGKTTTLRALGFRGQHQLSGSVDPRDWESIGGYWKAEPTVVSVFRGKGIDSTTWERVFAHYLNLRLSSLVVEYAVWLASNGQAVDIDTHHMSMFSGSCGLKNAASLQSLQANIDMAIVEIESKVNGRVSELATLPTSILGKPIEYLFAALGGLQVSLSKPFVFCVDEYENLSADQQRLLNTLVKQVGGAPFTFKIGVRNKVAIERATMIEGQPLQDTADFATIDIVTRLKDAGFKKFAESVITRRLSSEGLAHLPLDQLLPGLTLDAEAELLGAEALKETLLHEVRSDGGSEEEVAFAADRNLVEAALIVRWAELHSEQVIDVVRFALRWPSKWKTRVGNYNHAVLFTVRQRSVGERKYYTGWRTYRQLADGNIRYLLRLVQEALRRHVEEGAGLEEPVSPLSQTLAAKRVGEITVRDLQGWSTRGVALTRLTVGLGGLFGSLARSSALTTPEVVQFRVRYSGATVPEASVDALLAEAVGQGVLVDFVGNKEAAERGRPPELDYQLHPVLAPAFVYSHRSKRRLTIPADDLIALTQRETATAAFKRILSSSNDDGGAPPDQLDLFAGLGV
ncbi:hypothetical protein MRBLWO14_002470 [Microbacterium sp. LWO14-1.2]|uniref:ORC-CDC6 family AAA ATPase n=1 Tax=unclassified Microbacterium TaxID=2609290 RepID=UPI0031387285